MDDPTERERWRGKVDATLATNSADITILFRVQSELEKTCTRLELLINSLTGNVANLAMRIGMFATIGAFLGAAAVQYVISILTK